MILDVDNTLYQETQAGIEEQIIQRTHAFCHDHLQLSKEQADDLYHTYGSTVEGLKQTIWKDFSLQQQAQQLANFYQQVYHPTIDYSRLLPTTPIKHPKSFVSTGYSYSDTPTDTTPTTATTMPTTATQHELHLLKLLLQSSRHPIIVASNSPTWHVQKVLQALGLASMVVSNDHYQDRTKSWTFYTPDHPSPIRNNVAYPTKHTPRTFFGNIPSSSSSSTSSSSRIIVLDDNAHILRRMQHDLEDSISIQGMIHITQNRTIVQALMQINGWMMMEETFLMNSTRYLEWKNLVDQQSIHRGIWNQMVQSLQMTFNHQGYLHIVDVGAGLLSMVPLFLHGMESRGLHPLDLTTHKSKSKVQYTAYESNTELLEPIQVRLRELGFVLKQQMSNWEWTYEHRKFPITLSLVMQDFDQRQPTKDDQAIPPDIIVGCCFADLSDPFQLVPSLIRQFDLLRSNHTLLYFPITFCGTTQFVPPSPFEPSSLDDDSDRTIPSDTLAFQLYSQALKETMGHNLDPHLLQQAVQDYGGTLIRRARSDWNIDSKQHSYLYDTMLYFFGTTGGPKLVEQEWDATGWIRRAKDLRPAIKASNVDLLFQFQQPAMTFAQRRPSADQPPYTTVLDEIQFVEPRKVTSIQKEIPDELSPNQVLSRFCFVFFTYSFVVVCREVGFSFFFSLHRFYHLTMKNVICVICVCTAT